MSGSILSALQSVTIHNTMGALLVGVLLAVTLFGVATLQSIQYFQQHYRDPLYMRLMVGMIWLFELIHSILISHAIYILIISGFGKWGFLVDCPWSLKTSILFSGFVNATVLAFFSWRIKLVSGSWIIPCIAWFVVVVRTGFVLANYIFVIRTTLLDYTTRYEYLLTTNLVLGVALDIFTAVALCYYLANNRSGFNRSDRMISYLMRFSIETGLLASMVELAMLITFLTMRHSYIWTAFLVINAKTYSNSLLVSLNSRKRLRSKLVSGKLSDSKGSSQVAFGSKTAPILPVIAIEMKRSTVSDAQPNQRDDSIREGASSTKSRSESAEDGRAV